MAVEVETQLESWLLENAPEPSGGNPNEVITAEGTLAEPFGEVSIDDIIAGFVDKSATAYLTINFPGSPSITLCGSYFNNLLVFSLAISINGQVWLRAASAQYYPNGGLQLALVENQGTKTDVTANAGSITTTLVFVKHPLP